MLQRLGLSIPWNEQKRRAGFVVAWHLPCPFNLSIQSVRHLSFRINTLQQKKTPFRRQITLVRALAEKSKDRLPNIRDSEYPLVI